MSKLIGIESVYQHSTNKIDINDVNIWRKIKSILKGSPTPHNLRALANEETLFHEMFPRRANEETFAEQEIIMFLKNFRNIFASREANFASAKNASKGRKRGNIC